jgi:hypothetical protein
MGRSLDLFVLESERHFHCVIVHRVTDSKRHFAWIFGPLDLIGWEGITKCSPITKADFRVRESLVPKETVVSTVDFVPFIVCPLTFYSMEKVTHHSRMVLPATLCRLDFPVSVKVSVPVAVHLTPGDTYQLCSQVIDEDSISTFAVDHLV